MHEPLEFDLWLILKGWDKAKLTQRELWLLQACWREEQRPAAALRGVAAPAIRAAGKGARDA